MDELMISGRRYLSASRAAKEHGYHSDYIGQLIRGGKVKGQKVGRAWYVDAESLAVYLGKEIPATSPSEESSEEAKAQPIAETKKEEPAAQVVAPVTIAETTPAPEVVLAPVMAVDEKEEPTPEVTEPAEYKIEIKKPEHVELKKEETVITESVEEKSSGLVYVSDDEPMLPRITKERVVLSETVARPTFSAAAPAVKKESSGVFARGAALAVLGVVVLVTTVALSSLLVFTMSVGSTQTASVQFSLPQ